MSAVLVPSSKQAIALQAWALRALNTDDLGEPIVPAPFADEVVFIGERDHPVARRFCRLATISLTEQGPAAQSHEVVDVGQPGQKLVHHAQDQLEWVVSMTVVVRTDPVAPTIADTAGIYAARARRRFEGPLSTVQAGVGIEPLRRGGVTDAARLARSSEWETRVVSELVWICGQVSSVPVDWLEQVTGTGQLGELDPLPFDSNAAGP